MGGGDLNLKKSWHPHTLKNQERVWKAEQAKTQEDKKLQELKKEILNERDREDLRRIGESSGVMRKSGNGGDNKLEWMYKNSTELLNREEYLLGRAVDKSFEQLQAEEQHKEQNTVGMKHSVNHVEHECIPFSIRSYKQVDNKEQVDLQRKMMEDPLMLIKQREMDSRRKLLENPVKLKELHRLLKTDQALSKSNGNSSKKDKKHKKSKKNKRKHAHHADDSNSSHDGSETDLEKKIAKTYRNLKQSEQQQPTDIFNLNLSKLVEAKYETLTKELEKTVRQSNKRKRHASHSEDDAIPRKRHGNGDTSKRSRSPHQRISNRRRSRSRSADCSRKSRSPRSSTKNQTHTANKNEQKQRLPSSSATTGKKQLTEEEKEARRLQMMDNAAWREADRSKHVQKQREAYAREEAQQQNKEFDKDFINKQVKKAIANHDSVGSRLRANLNNIQRTKHAMDSNFAKK